MQTMPTKTKTGNEAAVFAPFSWPTAKNAVDLKFTMAGASLFTLLDDIIALLDDVSVMTKVATKKTAGVLGDDLALNAQQVSGLSAARELPVVWKVAIRSLLNKAILVPVALGLSAFAPWGVQPLLMLGGLYLCFEGAEKLLTKHSAPDKEMIPEAQRVAGAVRTDFVLSAEIVVIALGTVATAPFEKRVLVLVAIALLMTVGVYGLVAVIVKLDDLGLALLRRGKALAWCGEAILACAPWLLRALSVGGTVAMFLVGGGIVVHGIAPLAHAVESLNVVLSTVLPGLVGFACGAVLVGIWHLIQFNRRHTKGDVT
jgi:uncharacterized protein